MSQIRTRCCVPFCDRWRLDEPDSEYICPEHGKAIPRRYLKAYRRALAERYPPWLARQARVPRWMRPRIGSAERRAWPALFRLWARLRRAAIEGAL